MLPSGGMAVKRKSSYHHGNLAAEIVRVATAQLELHGEQALSLREVAREIGVDQSALYRHFKNKSALLQELAARGFAQMADDMHKQATRKTITPVECWRELGRAYVKFAVRRPALFRLMYGPYGEGSGQPVHRTAGALGVTPSKLLSDALRVLDAEGQLTVSFEAVRLMSWTTTHGLAALLIDNVIQPQAIEFTLQTMIDTMIVAPSPRKAKRTR